MSEETENEIVEESDDEEAKEAEREARLAEMEEEAERRFAEAKQKHKRACMLFDEDFGAFIFKAPVRMAMREFLKEFNSDEGDQYIACENLALGCVVHPTPDRLNSVMEELTGLAPVAAREIQKLSSVRGLNRGKGSRRGSGRRKKTR